MRGQAMDVRQRGLELDLLAPQPVAHAVQPHGEQADADDHDAQHHEVDDLAAGGVVLWVAARRQRHHEAEQPQRVEADPDDLSARQPEHAEHQDHREDDAHQAVYLARERVPPGRAEDRVEHLLDRERRVGEAPVGAAADHGDDDQHARDRGRRPPPDRPGVDEAEAVRDVQRQHAEAHHRRRQPCLRQPEALAAVGGEERVGDSAQGCHVLGRSRFSSDGDRLAEFRRQWHRKGAQNHAQLQVSPAAKTRRQALTCPRSSVRRRPRG